MSLCMLNEVDLLQLPRRSQESVRLISPSILRLIDSKVIIRKKTLMFNNGLIIVKTLGITSAR